MASEAPLRLHLTLNPSRGLPEARAYAEACELVVVDNVEWMRRYMSRGKRLPPTARAAGVRYVEPSASEYRKGSVTIDCAAVLLAKLCGPCGSIAAYDASYLRLRGREAWVEILSGGGGPGSWHAVVGMPGRTIDPTARMKRGRRCAAGCESW